MKRPSFSFGPPDGGWHLPYDTSLSDASCKVSILIAEDDSVTRRLLESTLGRLGWDVIPAADGTAAWHAIESLRGKDAPEVVLLDWMMPGMDGIEICRKLRTTPGFELVYVILLTSRSEKEDLAMGLAAGANDYITKPFHPVELESRVRVGLRMVKLQRSLAVRIHELEEALAHVQKLQGLLPICSYCKKVRNEANYWEQVDSYFSSHSDLDFTHSICPACTEKMLEELEETPTQSHKLVEGLEQLASGSLPESSKEVDADEVVGTEKTLDEAALMKLVGGNRELASELAELYLTDLEPRVNEITIAARARDGVRLRAAAHALRGSSGSIKAENVSAAAGVLEGMGQSGELDGVLHALELLTVAIATLRPRLVLLAGEA